ncbi:uncharacterized protein [Battus philenor]|uniref:uncharacterized protein n=1 Tax=Battus philenor TaxID=42288 RepID=UPI0035CF8C01
MFAWFIKFAVVFPLVYLRKIMTIEETVANDFNSKVNTVNPWNVATLIENIIHKYGGVHGKYCMNYLYTFYAYLTLTNLVFFLFKYVSTTLFMFRYMKSFYSSVRKLLVQKYSEFEDIKLQAEIIKTKISVREAELREQTENLQRALDRLHEARARVREIVADGDELRRAFGNSAKNPDIAAQKLPEQGPKVILILKLTLNFGHETFSEVPAEDIEYGEFAPPDPSSPDTSVYSSASESQKECHVKIVKVTNVYKVSYLKHFIKQKRLRRASKQALLKKKMEDIKKLLEDWQKTLNMVINSKLASFDVDSNHIERASQEAMGDYTKPQLREFSDSDSDLSWNQSPFRKSTYCFQDPPEMAREYYDHRDYAVVQPASVPCEWNGARLHNNLFIVAEETSSQMAIQEVKSEDDEDWDCRDMVSM